jgi:Cu/Ag efflux pump CusA
MASIVRLDARCAHLVVSTGASGRPVFCAVRIVGALYLSPLASSFREGSLFKPLGQLKLTPLVICIDIATL